MLSTTKVIQFLCFSFVPELHACKLRQRQRQDLIFDFLNVKVRSVVVALSMDNISQIFTAGVKAATHEPTLTAVKLTVRMSRRPTS